MKRTQLIKIIREGGATLNGDGSPVHFSRGYQVSRRDCFILSVDNVGAILRAVNGLLKGLTAGDFVGVWIDGGRVYIDISERIERLSDALRVGLGRGQKSIYDWCMDRCIALDA